MKYGRAIAPDTFRLERTLKAPIEQVWSFVVDGEKRGKWFCAGDTLTGVGQDFGFNFGHHRITNEKPPARWASMEAGEFVSRGTVLAFEPPRLVAFTWDDGNGKTSEVRIELAAVGAETRLTLTHVRISSKQGVSDFAGGWTAHFETLQDLLEGRPTNRFWGYVLEAEQAYKERIPAFDGPVVRVERAIKAPAERVYDAWLDPKMIERFITGPKVRDEENVHVKADARVGGKFSFLVRRNGQLIDHVGEYRELDRPRRIIFTWGVDAEAGDQSIVTIDIAPQGDGCVLTLTHQMHKDFAEYAERTQQGWTHIVGKLAEAFA